MPRSHRPDPELDREVLLAVTRRDPDALGKLFDAWVDRLFGLAIRLTGDRTLAEDVVHDVFLKVHRAAHTLDPGRPPGPWLMRITTNTCRDLWRSRGHRLMREAASLDDRPELRETLPGASENPEASAARSEEGRTVRAALMQLPEDMREVVILHDYQGLGHDEIAETIGVSHAAVRKRYSRALKRLAEALEDLER